jgi:hypothetical protein
MPVVMPLCLAFFMAAINAGFLIARMSGWEAGFVVSLPLSFFLPPFLQTVMKRLKI